LWADGILFPHLHKALFVNRNLCFCPDKFAKGVFCAKKAKTQNAFNKRFGKKPAESVLNQILFCYFASVSS